jgi:predicted DNA-binding protein
MVTFEERLAEVNQPRRTVKLRLAVPVADRLDELSARTGATKAAIVEAALRAALDPSAD